MCGIFGIISAKRSIQRNLLEKGTLALAHRGPDDSGYFIGEGVGLGHRRLSIIDLEGGRQPMFNEDRSLCIVFNGEIYNFPVLRDELLSKGHRFETRSDTETILHAYEEWGEDCVARLRGMFAFAIWDDRAKKLFLARDRMGIKPLFYGEYNGTFYFASEMKAILADRNFPRRIDELALTSYFDLSYIPAPYSIFRDIRKLLPGHTLTWQDGHFRTRQYWDLHFIPDRSKDENYFICKFNELFKESVKIHLISDVPLGAFLSGGVDSSAVVAAMSRVSDRPVNTFCMGFGGAVGGYLDERRYARMVADRYGTTHREYEIAPDPKGLVDKIVRAFDEPFADDSTIPSFFVCQIARENVTVAESGLGGDEAFAGYERYLGFRLRGLYGRLPKFLREGLLRRLVEQLPERADGHYTINHLKRFVRSSSLADDEAYFGFQTILNPNIRSDFFADRPKFERHLETSKALMLDYFNAPPTADRRDGLNRAFYCDIKTYLPEDILAVTDRMSMHHALEVRVPFLDHPLIEFCATIPPEMKIKWFNKKYLLKKAMHDFLPPEIMTHRKQGFVGPMTQWLKTDLKPYVLNTLSREKLKKHDLLNSQTVEKVLEEHFSGREIHDTLIWAMVLFQRWYDIYIEGEKEPCL
jgi:asparagine synthase (glutamine-hydrolysing)